MWIYLTDDKGMELWVNPNNITHVERTARGAGCLPRVNPGTRMPSIPCPWLARILSSFRVTEG